MGVTGAFYGHDRRELRINVCVCGKKKKSGEVGECMNSTKLCSHNLLMERGGPSLGASLGKGEGLRWLFP